MELVVKAFMETDFHNKFQTSELEKFLFGYHADSDSVFENILKTSGSSKLIGLIMNKFETRLKEMLNAVSIQFLLAY